MEVVTLGSTSNPGLRMVLSLYVHILGVAWLAGGDSLGSIHLAPCHA